MLKMFKYQCRNGENCLFYKQNKCKFGHIKYKDIELKNNIEDEFMISEKLLLDLKNQKPPILYIRHAEKQYKNGKNEEFSLDPDITEEGKIAALNKFKSLVDKYGIPERIISSPYLRTRTTAEIANSVIFEKTNINIEIQYDNKLGECLKNQVDKDLNICLRPETLIHNPIHHETSEHYNNVIYEHTKESQYNTWYITHGFNIYTIALMKKRKIKYPDELCGIVIDDRKITTI